MLMGQMMLSVMVAISAAVLSVMSGNGVFMTLLIYSAAGSMSLLTTAILVFASCPSPQDSDR